MTLRSPTAVLPSSPAVGFVSQCRRGGDHHRVDFSLSIVSSSWRARQAYSSRSGCVCCAWFLSFDCFLLCAQWVAAKALAVTPDVVVQGQVSCRASSMYPRPLQVYAVLLIDELNGHLRDGFSFRSWTPFSSVTACNNRATPFACWSVLDLGMNKCLTSPASCSSLGSRALPSPPPPRPLSAPRPRPSHTLGQA